MTAFISAITDSGVPGRPKASINRAEDSAMVMGLMRSSTSSMPSVTPWAVRYSRPNRCQ